MCRVACRRNWTECWVLGSCLNQSTSEHCPTPVLCCMRSSGTSHSCPMCPAAQLLTSSWVATCSPRSPGLRWEEPGQDRALPAVRWPPSAVPPPAPTRPQPCRPGFTACPSFHHAASCPDLVCGAEILGCTHSGKLPEPSLPLLQGALQVLGWL